jgi:hypothetical protein
MEPTTIMTKTTKTLRELSHLDVQAEVLIGGVEHFIESSLDGDYWIVFSDKSSGCFSVNAYAFDLDAEVTVTEERPMTVADLEVGDCFVTEEDCHDDSFCTCISDDAPGQVQVLRIYNRRVRKLGMAFDSTPVTLVTPTFEAEPVRESETVPVEDTRGDEFEFQGKKGHAEGPVGGGFEHVTWGSFNAPTHDGVLPKGTPVTVQTDATYDSWDDVSVGDVALAYGNADSPCIYLGGRTWLPSDGRLDPRHHDAGKFKPARLTSVSWERIPEVER